jgi:hypothetical protein
MRSPGRGMSVRLPGAWGKVVWGKEAVRQGAG